MAPNQKHKPKPDAVTKAADTVLDAAEKTLTKVTHTGLDVLEGVIRSILPGPK